ncbi:MAG: hypothetical protein J6C55_01355 [Oscillospiraceae bacterium]|nr:hypothetical protein [Oscillospiraceae bacterium]
MNISDEKIKNLISMASKNLGISETEFKNNLKNKNFKDEKINDLLNNPKKAQEMLEQPQIKKLISKFLETE